MSQCCSRHLCKMLRWRTWREAAQAGDAPSSRRCVNQHSRRRNARFEPAPKSHITPSQRRQGGGLAACGGQSNMPWGTATAKSDDRPKTITRSSAIRAYNDNCVVVVVHNAATSPLSTAVCRCRRLQLSQAPAECPVVKARINGVR
jgi:hypothetical protein